MARTRAEYEAHRKAICAICKQPRWKHSKWALPHNRAEVQAHHPDVEEFTPEVQK